MAALKTLAFGSARSAANVRPGFEPQSTTRPLLVSGSAKGDTDTTLAARMRSRHSGSAR
jgi:hypothetical protein